MTTYVYDGTEVVKTGREAVREISVGRNTRKVTLVEIKPVDESFDWKKWVEPSLLYVVVSN